MSTRVAHSFAQAMAELAQEKQIVAAVKRATEELLTLLEVSDVKLFLEHPRVPSESKKTALRELIAAEHPPELLNFLSVIIDRKKEKHLQQILQLLLDQLIKAQGYEIIEIVSAAELGEEGRTRIINDLEAAWNTKLYARYRINPSLIGGMIIRRGDYLYDGSLTGQLQKLKQKLLS